MQAGLECVLQQLVEKQREPRKIITQNTFPQYCFFQIPSENEKKQQHHE